MARKDFDLLGSKVINLADGVNPQDGVTKQQLDAVEWDYDAKSNRIINLSTPIYDTDATNKGYVDTSVDGLSDLLDRITTTSTSLSLVSNPAYSSPAKLELVTTTGYLKYGTTSIGAWNSSSMNFYKYLNMNNNKITNVGTPTSDTDAATKKYVDDNAGGGSARVVMYNQSKSINNYGSATFNLIPSGVSEDFKNIQIFCSATSISEYIWDDIVDFSIYPESFFYSSARKSSTSFFYMNFYKTNTLTIYNGTNVTATFTVKVTGELK